MATPSSSTTVFRLRPQAPGHHLPPHIIERHRRVLAGILHKRFLIDRWRRNVVMAAEPEPRERPTYQSRLREQFLELRDALPALLKPKAADRVAIMENAMYYIVGLKNALHVIQGRPMESLPAYISHELQGASLTQQRTYHENCTIRMLCQVVEGLSGVESKIQLLEQATTYIRSLEEQYQRLQLEKDASRQIPRPVTSSSSSSSEFSLSCRSTPDREPEVMDVDDYSSESSDRLPSIYDILRDKSPLDDLQLPPLRMLSLCDQ
ncbi:uncharacterized protein ARMOST_13784 [Armillaria ostoyae]|uniref:BHLH domain-containing protein n=1 Tax=Armillaria ostoyae TaxID=47428 RepID=A0A284RNT9_ARMOS|nr:uncharacterized protein ARMOST_13784 [Armillaria ostoyae]